MLFAGGSHDAPGAAPGTVVDVQRLDVGRAAGRERALAGRGDVAPRLQPRTVLLGVSPIDFVEAESQDAVDKYFASTSVRDDWLASVDRSLSRASALVRERRLLRDPRTIADSIGRRVSGESGPKLLAGQVDAFGRAPPGPVDLPGHAARAADGRRSRPQGLGPQPATGPPPSAARWRSFAQRGPR